MSDTRIVLISFDIDGTLDVGDPPGGIPLTLVRRALRMGYVVGSSSDRTVRDQQNLWRAHQIDLDFVGHKHKLDEIKQRFPGIQRWVHVGDGNADELYARMHGFEFHWAHELPAEGSEGWIF